MQVMNYLIFMLLVWVPGVFCRFCMDQIVVRSFWCGRCRVYVIRHLLLSM